MTFPEQAQYYRENIKGKVIVMDSTRYYKIAVCPEEDTFYVDYADKNWDPMEKQYSTYFTMSDLKTRVERGRVTLEDPTEADLKVMTKLELN